MSTQPLTRNQQACLVEIHQTGHASSYTTKTVSSLRYTHGLIEPATLGGPHPTNSLAMWRLTADGLALLDGHGQP